MVISRDTTKVLKGIAIIMVVISHLHNIYNFDSVAEQILNPCGYLGVSLFLMLSGYGCAMSNSKNSLKTLFKRIKRIIIPLAICTLFSALIITTICPPPSLLFITLQTLGINSKFCPPMWYISFQFLCYLIYYLIGNVKSNHQYMIMSLSSGIILLLISVNFDVEGLGAYLWGLNAFSFQAGMIFAKLDVKDRHIKYILTITSLIFVFMFIFTYIILGNPDDLLFKNSLKGIIALMFATTVFMISYINKDQLFCMAILKTIGDYSFYIYLIHAFLIFSINSIVFSYNGISAIIYLLIIVTICCPLLKKIDEKIKSLVG